LELHGLTSFEGVKVCFDAAQAAQFVGDALLDLCSAHAQHPSQFLGGELVVEEGSYLPQSESQVAQGQESVQAAELGDVVGAVTRLWIDTARYHQTRLVVVAQHSWGYLPEASESADVQHDTAILEASHRVKVKTNSPQPLLC
jgi:hypothetical protein